MVMVWSLKCSTKNVFFIGMDQKVDLIFAFGADGPNSIAILEAEKRIAKAMIDDNKIKDIEYNIISYGNNAQFVLYDHEITSTSFLKRFIGGLSWRSAGLAIDDVIRKATQYFETKRTDSSRVLVLFVSGKAKPDEVDALRRMLADERVNIIVIALSSDNPQAFDPLITPEKPVITTDPTTDSKTTSKKVINGITNGKMGYNVRA